MQESLRKNKILFRPKRYERKQRSKWTHIIFGGLFLIMVAAGIAYGLFFSPLFEAREIVVIDQKGVPTPPALRESLRLALERKSRLLMAWESSIKNAVIAQFPEVADVRIEKNFTERILTVRISLREMAAIWCKAKAKTEFTGAWTTANATSTPASEPESNEPQEEITNCFYVDQNGIAFQEAPLTFGALITLMKDFSGREIALGTAVAEPRLITFMVEFKKWLAAHSDAAMSAAGTLSGPAAISEFLIEQGGQKLKGRSAEGWDVIFNDSQSAQAQGFIVKKVLEEEIKEKRANLEYIDLRLENRVYYKLREMTNDQ